MKCLPQKELGEKLGHPYNGITSPFVLGRGEVSGVVWKDVFSLLLKNRLQKSIMYALITLCYFPLQSLY